MQKRLWHVKFPTFDSVKDKRLAEREQFSDVEDSEDEDKDFEDFTVPVQARKRKIASSEIVDPEKIFSERRVWEPPDTSPAPPPRRPSKPKASQIASKN